MLISFRNDENTETDSRLSKLDNGSRVAHSIKTVALWKWLTHDSSSMGVE